MPLLKVNIKHRKVERLLFLRMMFSSIFLQFVIISNTEALPDIIKIGKRTLADSCQDPFIREQSCFKRFSKTNTLYSGGLFDVTDQMKEESGQTRQEIAFR